MFFLKNIQFWVMFTYEMFQIQKMFILKIFSDFKNVHILKMFNSKICLVLKFRFWKCFILKNEKINKKETTEK
jgi:hypothetical protein